MGNHLESIRNQSFPWISNRKSIGISGSIDVQYVIKINGNHLVSIGFLLGINGNDCFLLIPYWESMKSIDYYGSPIENQWEPLIPIDPPWKINGNH